LSGGALRARAVDAVKRGCALLERSGHPPQRTVEHRSGESLEQPRLEGEVDGEVHVGPAIRRAVELPFIVQIFERTFDIIDADLRRPLLHDPAGETLLERVEADDEVGDRLLLARRA